MIFQLDDSPCFPDPHLGEPDGLLAVDGDLSVERLKLAYSLGIFPWYSFKSSRLLWWCPMERFVLFPAEIHVSHSMRSLLNSNRFSVTFNKDFHSVISGCSSVNDRHKDDCAWLGPDMIEAYTRLHSLGLATSVEVWENGALVGGFYGVTRGRCFFGESMFSLVPNASKYALVHLAKHMQQNGGVMIDCQVESKHLASMGARTISYDEYMGYVNMK